MNENTEFSHLLGLFDLFWHHHQILNPPPSQKTEKHPPPPPPPPPRRLNSDTRQLRRSFSDESSTSTLSAPNLRRPKLATVISGQEATFEELAKYSDKPCRRRRRRGKSKSLSNLEFVELKGFMDLGFTFSELERDSKLMKLVPALQRLATSETAGNGGEGSEVKRPYLSEAWEEQEVEELLRNWMGPVAGDGDGEELKDHIKFWARAVASTVR